MDFARWKRHAIMLVNPQIPPYPEEGSADRVKVPVTDGSWVCATDSVRAPPVKWGQTSRSRWTCDGAPDAVAGSINDDA